MMFWFLFSTGLASDIAQMEQVSENTWEIMDGLSAITAFLVDESLVEAGHAPPGWEQPPMEVYESELGRRPSMLPFEHYLDLVVAGYCPADGGHQYLSWEEDRLSTMKTATGPWLSDGPSLLP
jgi:hypothetical protein